jgi:hypothetical protein
MTLRPVARRGYHHAIEHNKLLEQYRPLRWLE